MSEEERLLGRRREDRVGSCLFCGTVLGIWIEGEAPKLEAHYCLTHDALDRELDEATEMLDEMRATRQGKGDE